MYRIIVSASASTSAALNFIRNKIRNASGSVKEKQSMMQKLVKLKIKS